MSADMEEIEGYINYLWKYIHEFSNKLISGHIIAFVVLNKPPNEWSFDSL